MRRHWLVLFLLSLFTASSGHSSCIVALSDDEMKALTTRANPDYQYPEQDIYIQNTAEALKIFAAWIKSPKAKTSYAKMINQMHKTVALGAGKTPRPYQTESYNTKDIFPGHTRAMIAKLELYELPDDPARLVYKVKHHNYSFFSAVTPVRDFKKAVYEALMKIDVKNAGKGTKFKVQVTKYNETFELSGVLHGQIFNDKWDFELKAPLQELGLEGETNDRFGVVVRRQVPEALESAAAIARGAALMAKIKKLFKQTKPNQDQLLELLADYYHVMINPHLFYRINHSLFLNQVNYILVEKGFRPLGHDHVDLWAYILDYQQFRRFFKGAFAEAQAANLPNQLPK